MPHPSSLHLKFPLQNFVVWPCSRQLKHASFSRTNLIFSVADLLSKALHLQMGCPWWLGCIQQHGFSSFIRLLVKWVCPILVGSDLKSQNLYYILSLNSSRRSSSAGNLSLMISGCSLLVTIFIHSFSMVSGSLSSIMLKIVELLISFSRPMLFKSLCALSMMFIISSVPLGS